MNVGSDLIHTLEAPTPQEIGETPEEFLRRLGGPSWLRIPGLDRSRTRAVSTLLHGNEPSGVRAIFQWIRSGKVPLVDLVCFVGSVKAALAPPGFANRFLPGEQDLNRCFREPFLGTEGKTATELLQKLREAKPESLVDLHNTSGKSPSYAVASKIDLPQKALTSLFTDHIILTKIRLGTLMEAMEPHFPTITIECGAANDHRSDQVAFEGLTRYAMSETVFQLEATHSHVQVFEHPIRVELQVGSQVKYAESPAADADVTLRPDVDQFNFGVLPPGKVLGWLGPRHLHSIVARDGTGQDRTQEIFVADNGCLRTAQPARLLMMTTNPHIAKSDCLFYFLPVDF